jgi:hypothetical protein
MSTWFDFMSSSACPVGSHVKNEELVPALEAWRESGRWDPILEEWNA